MVQRGWELSLLSNCALTLQMRKGSSGRSTGELYSREMDQKLLCSSDRKGHKVSVAVLAPSQCERVIIRMLFGITYIQIVIKSQKLSVTYHYCQ